MTGQVPLLKISGLPTATEQRGRVHARAGDGVSEEAEQARKDAIDVAAKTVAADEHVRDEVNNASERRREDTGCAFIVPLLLDWHACTVCVCVLYSRTDQQQLPDTNRVRQQVPPTWYLEVGSS
jgi:hypothetical protein